MTTRKRIPRNGKTAREVAENRLAHSQHHGNGQADPRENYLSRAEERRQKIRELRKTGLSIRAIAVEVGCSVDTVHNAINIDA